MTNPSSEATFPPTQVQWPVPQLLLISSISEALKAQISQHPRSRHTLGIVKRPDCAVQSKKAGWCEIEGRYCDLNLARQDRGAQISLPLI